MAPNADGPKPDAVSRREREAMILRDLLNENQELWTWFMDFVFKNQLEPSDGPEFDAS